MFVADPVGSIREGLAVLAAEDRSTWSAAARSARLAELVELSERLEAEQIRCAAGWDAVGAWADDRAASPAAWLAAHTPTTRGTAARLVRSARLVQEHEQTAAALADGDITAAHVSILAAAAVGREPQYAEHQAGLLTAASALAPDDLAVVARRWRCLADDELARRDAHAAHERRHLHLSTTLLGGVLDGFLEPAATATVVAALDAMEPPDPLDGPELPRTLSQRRADALVKVCEAALGRHAARGAVPRVGMDVVVDLDTFTGRIPVDARTARCDIAGTGPVARVVLERLACEAAIGRIVVRGRREIIDVGCRTRVISPALRRAVVTRDEHCRHPGCRAPAAWCDVHHLVHWNQGGPTAAHNLVLLCRRHHVATHEGGRRLARAPDGELVLVS